MAEEQSTKRNGIVKRLLRPLLASAASAATAYGIRKVTPILRDKLGSLTNDGSLPGKDTLAKAKDAVEEKVSPAISRATQRTGNSRPSASLSPKQVEARQRQRAQHRREREKALRS